MDESARKVNCRASLRHPTIDSLIHEVLSVQCDYIVLILTNLGLLEKEIVRFEVEALIAGDGRLYSSDGRPILVGNIVVIGSVGSIPIILAGGHDILADGFAQDGETEGILEGILDTVTNLIHTKQQPGRGAHDWTGHETVVSEESEGQREQPHREGAERMPGVVERDGRLVDALTFADGVAQLLHLAEHGETFAAGPAFAVGDRCNLSPESIARPKGPILGVGNLGHSSVGEERPGQRPLVDPALARETTPQNHGVGRSTVGLVIVVTCFHWFKERFGKEDPVLLRDVLAVAFQALWADVMTEHVGEGRQELRHPGSPLISNVRPVQVHHPRQISAFGQYPLPDLSSLLQNGYDINGA